MVLVTIVALGLWLGQGPLAGREARTIRRAIDGGRWDEASRVVERWLRSSPHAAEAHYLKALIAWARNDLPLVDEELMRARSLGYRRQPLARLRGLLLARANRASEAEPLLREALASSSAPDPEVAEALVRLYLGTFRLGEAAEVLNRWSRQAPGDAQPYLLQTEIDTRLKAAPEVIFARYRAALARDPGLDQAHFGLAEQLRFNHHNAEAAAEYAAYLARKPDDPMGYLGAGQNALEMGALSEAARLLDRALALAPQDSEALAARATLELRRGRFEQALHYFDRAVKAFPFDSANRYQRMLILSRLGKKAEADRERRNVERLKNDEARFGEISRALLRKPLDPELRSEAAAWLMAHGREDEAVEWANLVLRSDPSHPAMNRLLADYYRKKGQVGLANLHQAHAARRSEESVPRP
jgi:tetratricopeptide (TPR) repeat protein